LSKFVDDYHKQAIWEAYDKKCFYCQELLPFKNIHIDHVIPQNSFIGHEAQICTRYKLSRSFEFNFLDNFVSSCQSCNSARKREYELENGIPLWLNEAEKKKKSITERASKLKIKLSFDLPDEHKNFFVSSPDFMLSNLSIDQIRKKDVPLYKELTFNNKYYPLSLTDPGNEKKKVRISNLSEFERYIAQGYYPYTTPEISLASVCEACLTFFTIFEEATSSKIHINLKDYFLVLPIELLHPMLLSCDDDSLEGLQTVGDFLESDQNISYKTGANFAEITIEHELASGYSESEHLVIDEILQANFTNNSDTEVLLFVYYKSAGTLRFSTPKLVGLQSGKWHALQISG